MLVSSIVGVLNWPFVYAEWTSRRSSIWVHKHGEDHWGSYLLCNFQILNSVYTCTVHSRPFKMPYNKSSSQHLCGGKLLCSANCLDKCSSQ